MKQGKEGKEGKDRERAVGRKGGGKREYERKKKKESKEKRTQERWNMRDDGNAQNGYTEQESWFIRLCKLRRMPRIYSRQWQPNFKSSNV